MNFLLKSICIMLLLFNEQKKSFLCTRGLKSLCSLGWNFTDDKICGFTENVEHAVIRMNNVWDTDHSE